MEPVKSFISCQSLTIYIFQVPLYCQENFLPFHPSVTISSLYLKKDTPTFRTSNNIREEEEELEQQDSYHALSFPPESESSSSQTTVTFIGF